MPREPMAGKESAAMQLDREDHKNLLVIVVIQCGNRCKVTCNGEKEEHVISVLGCRRCSCLDFLHFCKVVLKEPVCTCCVTLGGETRHYECQNEEKNPPLSQFDTCDLKNKVCTMSDFVYLYCTDMLYSTRYVTPVGNTDIR